MKRSQSFLWLVLAMLFAVGATTLILSYMVTDPGHVIIQLGGDCGKNYFTYLYHSIYGKGVWFEGMNYPYGEHIIYADGQPILSSLLHHIKGLTIRDALAIMNLAISFSYVLAIVFTYKILERFGVKPFIAILFACLINLCAPQVLRVRAHFALAYLCPIPMLFYFTLLYHYSRHWKWALCIFIMGFIMAFIHLYTGALIFIWVAFYALGYILLIKTPLSVRIKHVIPILVATAGLFVAIKVCIALTDPVKDRPTFPLNTLDYVTRIKDLTTSPYSSIWMYAFHQKWLPRLSEAGEGFAYLGLASVIVLIVSLITGIVKKVKKRPAEDFIISENGFSRIWLFIGFGSLCLAMGIPFIWNMQWLLNYLSLFKQFRAMGRFSWIFYYVATIYSAVVIYTFYARAVAKQKVVAGYSILLAALLLWGFESKGYIDYTRAYIANGVPTCDEFFYKDQMKWPEYLATQKHKGSDFQGIILLPFFVSGSEKLWVGGDPSWPLAIGMRASLEFHLPIVDVMMSRTSWSVTEKQVKTIAGPFAYKPMLHDVKSNKPFLVIHYEGDDINQDEQYLLWGAENLGHHFGAYLYAVYPDMILGNDRKIGDAMKATFPYMHSMDTCVANHGDWYVDHFDAKPEAEALFGSGARAIVHKDSVIIANIPVKPVFDKQNYEFSCWFLLDDKDYRSPYVNLQELDSAGNVIYTQDALTKLSTDNSGMWFRASTYILLKADCRRLRCVTVNEVDPTYKLLDELMLRPADAVIISKAKDGRVMINNHFFHEGN